MKENICEKCKKIKNKQLCGQGFTLYTCKICMQKKQHANTCVPLLCEDCAQSKQLCQECQKPLPGN